MPRSEADQDRWIRDWADRIRRSGWATLALPLLEIGQGMGFIAGQALLLGQPVLMSLTDEANIDRYVELLGDPVAWERLIDYIERKAPSDG